MITPVDTYINYHGSELTRLKLKHILLILQRLILKLPFRQTKKHTLVDRGENTVTGEFKLISP